ncbi:MAG: hypothetical protein WCO33_01635 [bacterium]
MIETIVLVLFTVILCLLAPLYQAARKRMTNFKDANLERFNFKKFFEVGVLKLFFTIIISLYFLFILSRTLSPATPTWASISGFAVYILCILIAFWAEGIYFTSIVFDRYFELLKVKKKDLNFLSLKKIEHLLHGVLSHSLESNAYMLAIMGIFIIETFTPKTEILSVFSLIIFILIGIIWGVMYMAFYIVGDIFIYGYISSIAQLIISLGLLKISNPNFTENSFSIFYIFFISTFVVLGTIHLIYLKSNKRQIHWNREKYM